MLETLGSVFAPILEWLRTVTGNYGLAIIAMTIITELILLPLNIKQTKAMNKINELQPKREELEKKYKNDKETLNIEISKLYKEQGANPLMGCLPMILQFPIMMGLFWAVRETSFNEGFLFIRDLGAQPTGMEMYVMIILAAGSTFLSTKIMSYGQAKKAQPDSTQMLTYMMPIMMGWLATTLPAGVSFYWVVRNLFSIVKQIITGSVMLNKSKDEPEQEVNKSKKRIANPGIDDSGKKEKPENWGKKSSDKDKKNKKIQKKDNKDKSDLEDNKAYEDGVEE